MGAVFFVSVLLTRWWAGSDAASRPRRRAYCAFLIFFGSQTSSFFLTTA
jgi:hypothetical protein